MNKTRLTVTHKYLIVIKNINFQKTTNCRTPRLLIEKCQYLPVETGAYMAGRLCRPSRMDDSLIKIEVQLKLYSVGCVFRRPEYS